MAIKRLKDLSFTSIVMIAFVNFYHFFLVLGLFFNTRAISGNSAFTGKESM